MSQFNSSLLREKFTIKDTMPADDEGGKPVIALSNRLVVPLTSVDGKKSETLVVRAQNMHSCVRMAAQIAKEFHEQGPLVSRPMPVKWGRFYDTVTEGYEREWNPHRWIAVYHKGVVVFQEGKGGRHPFLDIIEQCDARSKGGYEKSVEIAQDAFKQAGKLVTIEHDANVALVLNINKQEGKCGVILRGPNRTTTFNMTARKKGAQEVYLSQCMSASAAFLEGIQLAFFVGMTRQKLHYELIAKGSQEAKQLHDATERLTRLGAAIDSFEKFLEVTYRPERPRFNDIVNDAEDFARKILAAEIEKKISEGGGAGDWVL